jgi:hypothetical protein
MPCLRRRVSRFRLLRILQREFDFGFTSPGADDLPDCAGRAVFFIRKAGRLANPAGGVGHSTHAGQILAAALDQQ